MFVNERLYVFIGNVISPWYSNQFSPAPHLKGWYCSPVSLFDSPCSHIRTVQIGNTDAFMKRAFVIRVMFQSFLIFKSIETVVWSCHNQSSPDTTELPPSLIIIDPRKLIASTWSSTSPYHDCSVFHLEVESELLTCSLHPFYEV